MKDKEDIIQELEMSKKRDHKIEITQEAIEKVPKILYKEIDSKEYDTIWNLAQQVLKIAKQDNQSNEVAITYSMDSDRYIEQGERYIGVSLGTEHSVDPLADPTSYHLVYSATDCVVIVLHNHPSLSAFSIMDIQFLLKYQAVKMMVVVTNLGNISYLVKNNKYDFAEALELLQESIQMNQKARNLKEAQKAASHFMRYCHKVGIIYEDR